MTSRDASEGLDEKYHSTPRHRVISRKVLDVLPPLTAGLNVIFVQIFWVNFVTRFSIVFYVNVRCQTLVRIREGWEKRHKMKLYRRLALHKFISLS